MVSRFSPFRWIYQHSFLQGLYGSGQEDHKGYCNFVGILSTKRARLAATTGIAFLVLLTLIQHFDVISTTSTWSRPSSDHQGHPGLSELREPAADVDWSRFAYVQYVTNSDYLCNAVMIFETLHRLGSRADRVMMFPSNMFDPDVPADAGSRDARLLATARDEYGVHLAPISVQRRPSADNTWAESFTKLLAFNQTQYSRVLSLDSDGVVLQPMDELFLLPPCPVAMPRAYWLYPEKKILSSQVMLVEPSAVEFERIMDKIDNADPDDYDMEIVNYLYQDSALILPHRPYDLLTAEFRFDNHERYLGTDREEWDPVAIYNEAKYVHFSDWPVPKPWIPMSEVVKEEMQPKCYVKNGVEQCVERELWNGFYNDFVGRREQVCNGNGGRRR